MTYVPASVSRPYNAPCTQPPSTMPTTPHTHVRRGFELSGAESFFSLAFSSHV